jgi:hypothetical protein
MMQNVMILLLITIVLNGSLVFADPHAPDTAPEITREAGWCENGSITRTTGECICSSHLGFYCRETDETQKGCQSGFGISFFHNKCTDCKCSHDKIPAGAWKERKNTLKTTIRKNMSQMNGQSSNRV